MGCTRSKIPGVESVRQIAYQDHDQIYIYKQVYTVC